MIVVTGGAGFIGSNLVRALNARGRDDIVVVDDLRAGRKFLNLVACEIADYWDRDEFLERLENGAIARPECDPAPGRLRSDDRVGRPLHARQQLPLFGAAVRVLRR